MENVTPQSNEIHALENSIFKLEIDSSSGSILSHTSKATGKRTQLKNQLYHYQGMENSGAYAFRPLFTATLVSSSVKDIKVNIE